MLDLLVAVLLSLLLQRKSLKRSLPAEANVQDHSDYMSQSLIPDSADTGVDASFLQESNPAALSQNKRS